MTDAPVIKQNDSGVWFLEGEQLWDSDLLPIILEHINPGDTVIDAGAWIGGHTMAYAKKVGENGKVIAFEPNPHAYNCLLLNAGRNADCFQMLLGDQRGIVSLSAKKGWYDSGYMGDNHKIADVPMEMLDFAKVAPNFIKIDVEGCELKVLKGAAKTIEKHRPIMVLEINKLALERQGNKPQEVFDWLKQNGYGIKIIEGDSVAHIYNILAIQ